MDSGREGVAGVVVDLVCHRLDLGSHEPQAPEAVEFVEERGQGRPGAQRLGDNVHEGRGDGIRLASGHGAA
jgi:hypothetical protein